MRTRRFAVVALVLVSVSSACSSSNSGSSAPPDDMSSSTPVPSSPETTSTAPVTSSDPSSPAETSVELDLASLPGRLAISSIGCGEFDPASFGSESSGDEVICVLRPDGSELVEIPVPDWALHGLEWTWDGERLIVVGEESVWIVDRDGTDLTQRAFFDQPPYHGSPDGAWRLSTRRGENGFWITPFDATREAPGWRQVTFDPEDCCVEASWSPDSTRIAYTAITEDCGRVKISDLATTSVAILTGPGSPNETVPTCAEPDSVRWSPDGTRILFLDVGLDFESSRPMVVSTDGRELRPFLAGLEEFPDRWITSAFAWSPDGSAVAVIGSLDGSGRLFVVAVDGSAVVEVPLPEEATLAGDLAWAPG